MITTGIKNIEINLSYRSKFVDTFAKGSLLGFVISCTVPARTQGEK